MEKENRNQNVQFANNPGASFAGTIGGSIIAVGVPWVVLVYGQSLGHTVQTWTVIGSIILGGFIILISAFFGLVMPSQVNQQPGENSERHNKE